MVAIHPNFIGAAFVAVFGYFLSFEIKHFQDIEEAAAQTDYGSHSSESFDFIIVGAGTAGCILANRLSEKYRVLLLEAGGPQPPILDIPTFREYSIFNPEINFLYESIPQKNAGNKTFLKPAGKMMGGSYAHNELFFNRGNSRDFDEWARLTKDPSWEYNNLLKYFKMIESYEGPFQGPHRGTNGPVPVFTSTPPILETYIQAVREAGYGFFDPNGPQQEGLAVEDFSQIMGRAVTTCTLYVNPILGIRTNLKLIKYAEVTKIITNYKSASGVVYTKHGVERTAYANKEVIISAGALGSPMVLFKSGIGPPDMLFDAHIPIVSGLPVGTHMEDHPGLRAVFTINDTSKLRNVYNNLTAQKISQYFKSGDDGILSELAYGPQGFFVTPNAKEAGEEDWPDIQFIHQGDMETASNKLIMVVMLNRPKGAGEIRLNTEAWRKGERDNTKLALIDFKYLEVEKDVETFLQGIRIAERIRDTNTFRNLDLTLIPNEECAAKHKVNSDEYWLCAMMVEGSTQYHTVGTCPMGFGPGDPKAVVDTNFRVIGVERLRVIDASVFPRITNANPNAPTMLVAEIGAEKILESYP